MIYLSCANIDALGISAGDVADQVMSGFKARGAGAMLGATKQHIKLPDKPVFFQSLPSVHTNRYACVKWIGVSGVDARERGGEVSTMLLLSDATTAWPLAIMDARWITMMRTAAVSLIGAHLIKKQVGGEAVVGILGTGAQASAHLDMFSARWPTTTFMFWGRRDEAASKLRDRAVSLGYDTRIVACPDALIRECDIVISALGAHTTAEVGLNAFSLPPDAFLSLVDLGRPWIKESLKRLVMFSDDQFFSRQLMNNGVLPFNCELEADLVTLSSLCGKRLIKRGPFGLLHPGVGYADLAVAERIYETAVRLGIGTQLK